jgi:hypothetical protein
MPRSLAIFSSADYRLSLPSGLSFCWRHFDRVNVQLPASLAGRDVPLILSVAGKYANTARLTFK